MPSLLELQRGFAAGDASLFSVPARLGVYRGNTEGNCVGALASAYPIVRKIVGNEFFDSMARQFVRAHPSQCGDLHRYGEPLADFVAGFAPVADLPYLPDVARMEWLAHCAYFAADPAAFELGAVQSPELLRPRLAPACALMASAWPLGRLWTVHQDDYEGAFEVDLGAGPDCIVVHRPRWRVQVRSLAAGDWAFLGALSHGATLGEALAVAAEEDADFDHVTALARWIDAGVIAHLV